MASRFWVGGTGAWDASDTTHWAASSGGAGGQSVPGSADAVTFDGSSGGGTVTLNFGGTITVQSITFGAFTGTWDNSVNNNNITVTASGNAINGTGTAVRTIKLGSATYTLSNNSGNTTWNFTTTTNLTLQASSATISFTGGAASKNFNGGSSQTYGTVTFAAMSGVGKCVPTGNFTTGTLTVSAPNLLVLNASTTPVVSATLNLVGSQGNAIGVISDTLTSSASISIPASQTVDWCAFRDVTATTNTLTANDSFDLGHNSNININAPNTVAGGAVAGVIGS